MGIEDPRGRLRHSFVVVLERQGEELAALARDAISDPDIADALRIELDRLRGTAAALRVEGVEIAAEEALARLDQGDPVEAVRGFIAACRGLDAEGTLLQPVVVIGLELPSAQPYAWITRRAADVEEALSIPGPVSAYVALPDQVHALRTALEGANHAPIFAVGPRHDLGARLRAVKAGATGFLSEPLDMASLLAQVRTRAEDAEQPPYRVLLVEPDGRIAAEVKNALLQDDLRVKVLLNPTRLLKALDDFWPELVLMAPQVGGLSGLDLVAVLRAHSHFSDLPVLLRLDQEHRALADAVTVADELLLPETLTPALLRARVRTWLQRSRHARAIQEVDGLTGILSRASLLRSLERELALARRMRSPLAAVVLDLDQLHGINARFGLAAGDRALRGLAEILTSNLRHTDLIGRIGPDSFAALLPGCTAEDAERRVSVVRRQFQSWATRQERPELTFSAGVADTSAGYPTLLTRAIQAMGAARGEGGGRTRGT